MLVFLSSLGITLAAAPEGHAQAPVLSPDGSLVAYTVDGADRSGIAVQLLLPGRDPVLQNAEALTIPTTTPAREPHMRGPAWHKEGVLAFTAERGAWSGIYLTPPGGVPPPMLELNGVSSAEPAIAANGATLAMTVGKPGRTDIAIRHTHTGRIERFETDTADVEPAIDPTGRRVAFTRIEDGNTDIVLRDVTTGGERVLAKGPGNQSRPVFVRGGVLWVDERGERDALVMAPFEGGRSVMLAEGVRLSDEGRPAVSPDGEWVAYVPDDAPSIIRLTRLDGSEVRDLETGDEDCEDPTLALVEPLEPPIWPATAPGRYILAYTAHANPWREVRVMAVPPIE